MNIGERIKALRTNKGLTQEEFAQAVSVVRSHISLVEAGKREPSELMIKSIISAFPDISAQWLRTGEGEPFLATDAEAELGELVRTRLLNRPVDFRRELITALLRFDPDGPEWQVLETIVRTAASALPASDPAPRREGSPDPSALSAEAATPERTD